MKLSSEVLCFFDTIFDFRSVFFERFWHYPLDLCIAIRIDELNILGLEHNLNLNDLFINTHGLNTFYFFLIAGLDFLFMQSISYRTHSVIFRRILTF